MFRAWDVQSDREIISLDHGWDSDSLRKLIEKDKLVCPGCREPVLLRDGVIRRRHFAHKHLGNCKYALQSAELLAARAVLYEWLVTKFESGVTLEKEIEGIDLPRPVDCWVTKDNGDVAYWILDRQMSPKKRAPLILGLEHAPVHLNWVCLASMLRRPEGIPDGEVVLSTTERDILRHTIYDEAITRTPKVGSSLHYLHAERKWVATLRALGVIHEPQIYKGNEHKTYLRDLRVQPKEGGFVHPEEHELWKRYAAWRQRKLAEKERRKQKKRERRAAERARREKEEEDRRHREAVERERQEKKQRERDEAARKAREKRKRDDSREARAARERESQALEGFVRMLAAERRPAYGKRHTQISEKESRASPPSLESEGKDTQAQPAEREGACVFCGEITTDWWSYDGRTGTCKCRACLRAGRS